MFDTMKKADVAENYGYGNNNFRVNTPIYMFRNAKNLINHISWKQEDLDWKKI